MLPAANKLLLLLPLLLFQGTNAQGRHDSWPHSACPALPSQGMFESLAGWPKLSSAPHLQAKVLVPHNAFTEETQQEDNGFVQLKIQP